MVNLSAHNKPIQIGMDARPLSTKMSGVGRLISEILVAFPDPNSFHFFLFSHLPLHPDHKKVLSLPNITWSEEGGVFRKKGGLYFNLFLPFHIRSLSLDLFWGSQQVLPPCLPSQLAAVLTFCDLVSIKFPETMRKVARIQQRMFQKYSVQRSQFILSISQATSRDVETFFEFPKERTGVTYPSINQKEIQDFLKKDPSSFVNALPEEFILSVSTMEPRKNYPFLLLVMKRFLKKNLDKHWVIVGKKGWETQEFFHDLEEFSLTTKRVHILENVTDSDLAHIYQRASLFCFASVYEGFGIPLLEAMFAGLPCVVSDIPTFREIGGEQISYLTSTSDESCLLAWELEFQKRFSKEKKNYDLSKFSWEKAAQTTANHFQKAIREKKEV